MLSSIKRFFAINRFLLLANNDSIVLYENHKGKLTAKLTINPETSAIKLIKILKNHVNPRITLVLDPQEETQKIVSIPDAGYLKAKKELKKKLLNMPGDIFHPVVAHKPTKQDQNWKFLVTKADLNLTMRNLIQTLISHNIFISRVHLLSAGTIILCKRIQKIISKQISASKNSYFFIYLQNSNGELCEFAMKDNEIISHKSENISDRELCTYIQSQFTKNKLKLKEVPNNKVYLISLLPEQFRSNAKTDSNKFFLSARDISAKLLKRATSGVCNYSSILNEIIFVRNSPKHISIPSIKKLNFFKNLYRQSALYAVTISLALALISMNYLFLSYKKNIKIEQEMQKLQKLEVGLSKLEMLNRKKSHLLKNNSELNSLYKVINNDPYSLDMITDISEANTDQLPIDYFFYTVSDTENKQWTIKFNVSLPDKSEISDFFRKVESFADNLEQRFPSKEVRIYRKIFDNNLPITIKLLDME